MLHWCGGGSWQSHPGSVGANVGDESMEYRSALQRG